MHVEDQDSINVYFTRLKTFWEELNQFRPMCNCGKCVCNGVKNVEVYIQMDYTMTFRMGLNDSFAQIKSQILLIDPLPPINRVFALVIQEERQRVVGNHSVQQFPHNNMAFLSKGESYYTQTNLTSN